MIILYFFNYVEEKKEYGSNKYPTCI